MPPIRILHIVASMNRGGLETLILNLHRHVDREKIQFDYLAIRKKQHDYADEIQALGGILYQAPLVEDVGFLQFRKFVKDFLISHPEYKTVHCHMNVWSGFFLPLAKKAGIPVRIAHSHNTSTAKGLYGGIGYLFKLYAKSRIKRSATHFFACSQNAGEWLFGKYVKFTVLKNAIATRTFAYSPAAALKIRNELGLSNEHVLIGHVGRMETQKNHLFLLDIFREIAAQQPLAVLCLAGDGPLRQALEQKAQALGLSQSVRFLGVRKDIPELLSAVDIFLFPSLFEGFPVSIVEAQAAGLPCILSDTIAKECDLTGNVRFLSLKSPTEEWAKVVIEEAAKGRLSDATEQVKRRGHDSTTSAKFMAEFYLSAHNIQEA